MSAAIGGQHFIIDTSRSGQGDAGANQWCNPPDADLGLPRGCHRDRV
ncbi:glycoside hydrolase family 6 protein [bacterium]|nr:MAG: glycoside hydrolase family 6 protein [bacterium]